MTRHVFAYVLVAACSARSGSTSDSSSPPKRQPVVAPFTEYTVDTAAGLSGLRADDAGSLWAIPERERRLFRIALTHDGTTAEGMPIVGVPEGLELEDLTLLDGERIAFGAEGAVSPSAAVVIAKRKDMQLHVTDVIDIPEQALGLQLQRNAGVEGLCNVGDTMFAAIESDAVQAGRRWSPLVRIDSGTITSMHRIWLTTHTGRISALDCRERNGNVEAIAIERNFNETKILKLAISEQVDLEPTVLLDLGPILRNRLNLEGITWFRGTIAAINDNQWRGVSGPSELVVFAPFGQPAP